MIPTRSKAKIPKTMSYPVGAMALTEALANDPNLEKFALYFSDRPGWSASDFQRRLRDGLSSKVLVAEYRPAHNPGYGGKITFTDTSLYDIRWSLTVYPVLRERKHDVGELLRKQALPTVVEWLRGASQSGWDSHRHSIEFVFNPAENSLSVTRVDGV